ncbi:hypothetical protein ROU88_03065 [Macrococcus capreoli]|uniref:hypothetical protein n=1 Tax=Macrococcus capreoli TaxID=2982690 RepID=UPI0021D5BBBE|nr:hypothetical protein [Macrococcus sp. TMW 2.2395]MCU7558180.1 hypothetical protein [Macrococcus sp. TMW 2.2395]
MKANKYVYFSIFFVVLSIFCNGYNPVLNILFGSITSIILFTGLASCILLILSIMMIDKALKQRQDISSGLLKLAKLWPFVILMVIVLQLISILFRFGVI